MIFDCLKNAALYPFGPEWDQAFAFLKTADAAMENKKYVLRGNRLFAMADSYNTRPRDAAKLETHRKYIDIQVLLSGSERLEIYPKTGLSVSEPYNPEKDAEFYRPPEQPPVEILLTPGHFAVFFPEDAHMPCLMSGSSPQPVKKIVIKLAADCLTRALSPAPCPLTPAP